MKMVSCLANSREEHMISAPDDESSEEGSSSEEEEEGPAGGSDEGGSDDDDEAAAGSGEGEEKGEAEVSTPAKHAPTTLCGCSALGSGLLGNILKHMMP